MDIKEVKDLIKLMKEHKLAELELEQDGFKIKLKKDSTPKAGKNKDFAHNVPIAVPQIQPHAAPPQVPAPQQEAPPAVDDPSIVVVESPMVGTFYEAPAPNAQPFVKIGQDVNVDDTLCIIEAMKLMNEIKCEVKGKIVEVLVENGQAVEFNQPLFKIKKA